MKRIVLTFGLISGAVLSALMLATLPFHDGMDLDTAMALGYTTMLLAGLMVWFGVRRYRDTVAGGTMSFGRGFLVGLLITLVSSACYTATWEVVYFGGFAPDYMARYQEKALAEERANGATEAELAAKRAEMAKWAARYENPAINAAITFSEPLPVALLVALVSAATLRRRRGAGQGARAAGAQPA